MITFSMTSADLASILYAAFWGAFVASVAGKLAGGVLNDLWHMACRHFRRRRFARRSVP